jgi:hypothetical protein
MSQILHGSARTTEAVRRAIQHSQELLFAKELETAILEPAIAQRLVGEVVRVLQDGEARHEPGRRRCAPRNAGVDRPEALLQNPSRWSGRSWRADGSCRRSDRAAPETDPFACCPREAPIEAPIDVDKGRDSLRERQINFVRKRRQTQAEPAKR